MPRSLGTVWGQSSKSITRATCPIWAAHNIERIADRAVHICERTIYLATGKMPQVKVSKY